MNLLNYLRTLMNEADAQDACDYLEAMLGVTPATYVKEVSGPSYVIAPNVPAKRTIDVEKFTRTDGFTIAGAYDKATDTFYVRAAGYPRIID